MRMFDNRTSWLDNDGKPLAGRVRFCKLHTTEPEVIYNGAGLPLSNPVFTNTIGQLDTQVFLSDSVDYTVYFDKYVGSGDMMTDETGWLWQYTADDYWHTYGIEVEANSYQVVNTVADLRLLDPVTVEDRDGRKIVCLGGYNAVGDKPEVYYIWNASGRENDNGGNIISGSIPGNWELLNTFGANGVDVRHFGVFGTATRQQATSLMSLRTGVANAYAVSIGLPLFFPSLDGLTWYLIDNLNISGAIFAADTRVFGNTGTSSTITVYDESSKLNVYSDSSYRAVFTIAGGVVKTSWGENSDRCIYNPTTRLVIDSDMATNQRSFSNIVVECRDYVSTCMFDNCEILSIGKLGDNTSFSNCHLTEQMFQTNTDFMSVTTNSSDVINIDEWPTTRKWLLLASHGGTAVLDFKGRTLDSTCYLGWIGFAHYKNAVMNGYQVVQSSVAFSGCTGTVSLTNQALSAITLEDCNGLALSVVDNNVDEYINATNSTFSFNDNMYTKMMSLNRATASITLSGGRYTTSQWFSATDSTLNAPVISTPSFTAKHCNINANITSRYPVITDCTVAATIYQSATQAGQNLDFVIQRNVFESGAHHRVQGYDGNTLVVGKWIDNLGLGDSPIVLVYDLLGDVDYQHTYVYTGNSGTFLPTTASVTLDLTPVKFPTVQPPTPTYSNRAFFLTPDLVINPQGLGWYSGIQLDMEAIRIPVFYIGKPRYYLTAMVTWDANTAGTYTGTHFHGCNSATGRKFFAPPSTGPSCDDMNVWIQTFIQRSEDDELGNVKCTVTAEIIH